MRVAWALALLAAGAGTALVTVLLHQLWWGLVLGAAATLAVLVAVGRGWWTRLPFGLGWVAFVAWVVPARPEGDYVVSSDPAGYTLLGLALLVLVGSVATLPPPGRGPTRGSAPPPRMTG